MTALYYRSESLFEPGDVIQPGNWGRVISGKGPAHSAFYREYFLESIRRSEFQSKPSRMKAAFVFEDFEFARTWDRQKVEYIYSVKVADEAAPTCRTDMSWLEILPQHRTFD